jgi:hypothetical protein
VIEALAGITAPSSGPWRRCRRSRRHGCTDRVARRGAHHGRCADRGGAGDRGRRVDPADRDRRRRRDHTAAAVRGAAARPPGRHRPDRVGRRDPGRRQRPGVGEAVGSPVRDRAAARARVRRAHPHRGGDTNASSNSLSQLAAAHPQRFAIICDGAIKADAGIGTAITVKKFINPRLELRFAGGGNTTDVALLLQNIYGLDLDLYAQAFAGLVCKADGTTAANNLVSGRVRSLRAENCGQAINWKSINAFGGFDFLESINNQVAGDIFQLCADINCGFANVYYGTAITNGMTFDGCSNFNDWTIEAGDRATNAIIRVCADSGGTNIGRMVIRCSQYALAAPAAAVELDEVSSGDFEIITYGQGGVSGTNWSNIGVRVRGGFVNDVGRIRHHSQTRDGQPMKVEAHTTSTPNLRVEADYRFAKLGGVLIDSGLTGGKVVVQGRMAQLNQSATAATYGVDGQAAAAIVDVSGLEIPALGSLTGAVNHVNKNKLRKTRHAQLAGDTDIGRIVWTTRPQDCSGAAAMTAANQLRGGRVACPIAGTIKDLYIDVGTSSGNISVAIYDTKPTTRTQLWTSGAIACPATGWQKIADPNITVDEGQQLLVVITADNTTATFLRQANGVTAIPPAVRRT